MKPLLLFLIGISVFMSCSGIKKYTVFGYPNIINNKSCEVFIDRNGIFYPNVQLDKELINKNDRQLAGLTSLDVNNYYKTKDLAIDKLQDSILTNLSSKINEKLREGKYDNITFLMLGYNNQYKTDDELINGQDTGKQKLDKQMAFVDEYLKKEKRGTYFVKLYWDGTFSEKRINKAFNYTKGVDNSYFAGLALRRLINMIQTNKIYLISHSQGANVITQSLFNQKFKLSKKLATKIDPYYELKLYINPSQQIRAAIVAPAIDGYQTFKDYYERKNLFDEKLNDNYYFIVGYNKYDNALTKTFHINRLNKISTQFPLPEFLSSTTLGCDYNSEISFVADHFEKNFNKSKIDFVDFSFSNQIMEFDSCGNNKKCKNKMDNHALSFYLKLNNYNEIIDRLYSE